MKDIFAEFAQLLRKRFGQGVYTTEDSIRYTFFAALLAKSDLEAQDVVLEYPHPQIPGAEVDTLLTSVLPPSTVAAKPLSHSNQTT